MKILVSGSSGMVGGALVPYLERGGQAVTRLVRRQPNHSQEIQWDPPARRLDRDALEGFDAVVSLGGDNVGEGRWTADKKRRIVESRTVTTRLLADTFARMNRPPAVWLSASATGFYGNRGDTVLTEAGPHGSGFLAGVCVQWEAATAPAVGVVGRVVPLRIGVVLDPSGGALGKLLPVFRFGLGGPVGDGSQFMSWISLADVLGAVDFLLTAPVTGPVNLVSPHPATSRDFAKALGRALGRPAVLPAPVWALRLAFGEMADETVLSSARVLPEKLLAAGFRFGHPSLEPALRQLLGKDAPS